MKSLPLLLTVILCLSACEKLLFEEDLASVNPHENFEYLWQECADKYSYFELKNIDWEAVKREYAAKIFVGMSEDSLFRVLGGMLSLLKDDHANLIAPFNTSFFGVRYLGQDNFDWRIIEDHYLHKDYYISGPFRHNFIADGRVGYLRLTSFPGTIEASDLDFILNRYQDTQGLILDLRENGGGRTAEVFSILSRFVETETLVFYSRIKTGPLPDQFSALEPASIAPYSGVRYRKQVAVLTDRGTYSSGSLLALATKALSNMVLVGDTTGGGLGMPNGGQLPNGWRYRFSITQTLTLDQRVDYENGVPPDIPAFFDWHNLTEDEVLERALAELL